MIKLTATSTIHYISPVVVIPSKTGGNPFQKRDLILDDSWTKDNVTHPNFVLIEFSGDAMNSLDYFQPGQRVTVEAYVNGKEYQGRYFTTIRGISVNPVQLPQAAPQQYTAPQPQACPPAPGYPQQPYGAPAPAPAPRYTPPPTNYPQPQGNPFAYPQPAPGIDQLPFAPQ